MLEVLEDRLTPSGSTGLTESFDSTAVGSMPAGWSQWSSTGGNVFAVSSTLAYSAPNGLAMTASLSSTSARAWLTAQQPADVQVGADVFLNSLIPAQVFARGSNLNSTSPTYYALSITRNLEVQLLSVVNGVATTLGTMDSPDYISQKWAHVTLYVSGGNVRAQVERLDTMQYLNGSDQWQAAPAWALNVNDSSVSGAGQVGLGRPASYSGTVYFDDFSVTPMTVAPTTVTESFDSTPVGSLPAGWSQWSSNGSTVFAVSSALAYSAPNSLAMTAGLSSTSARAWLTAQQPADVQVGADVFLNSLIPAQIFARGSNLNSASPTYYALSITRNLEVQLLSVVNGVATTLGTMDSPDYISQKWAHVTLYVSGGNVRAQVERLDTVQYLNGSDQWQASPAWALNVNDSSVSGAGQVGLGEPASYSGAVYFDDFSVNTTAADTVQPTVAITAPAAGASVSGVVTVQAAATDNVGVTKVEFYVDNVLRAVNTTPASSPYSWSFDTSAVSNGAHTLMVMAYDAAGNIGQASETLTTQNNTTLPVPAIPQHYPNIRIAELAYSGNPMGSFEDQLLRSSVDLVVPNVSYLQHISSVSPNTPQVIYRNVSNLYLSLLTDWLNYADAHGYAREGAFYHVASATPFSGDSPSSQPVNWFWGVFRGATSLTDLTAQANGSGAGGVAFGAAGESVYIAYPDQFREINIKLASGAANGWSGVLEYPTAVDASGNPTTWAPLTTLSDTTAGLTRSGQILFDPPAGWKTATVNSSARMFYLRIRTLSGGTAPVASTILGRDYVGANGTTSGTIPAFDTAADLNHDGYLNDAEYAKRAPGKDARFLYESRAFYASYGQMRFTSNPSNLGFKNWAVDYSLRTLSSYPLANGLFEDNSGGNAPVTAGSVVEPVASYAGDYAAMLNAIGQAIAPRWILANTAGDGSIATAVVSKVPAYYEEGAIGALADNYQTFEYVAGLVAQRAALAAPGSYAVLDSRPDGGSTTDSRTQLATLAYYYLIADPHTTFLDFFGGYAPATSWTEHWSPAAGYNIGQPAGPWSVFATGADPSNRTLTYRVYQRTFANALVLYKPLSYGAGVTGTLANATATTYALNGTYSLLQADGTLGPVITSVSLRNGEGAILVKVAATTSTTAMTNNTTSGSTRLNGTLLLLTAPVSPSTGAVTSPSATTNAGSTTGTSTPSAVILPGPKAAGPGLTPASSGDGESMGFSSGTKFHFGLGADHLLWKKIMDNNPLFA
jgi:hypothetical protein